MADFGSIHAKGSDAMTTEHRKNQMRIERLERALSEALDVIAEHCPGHEQVLHKLSEELEGPANTSQNISPSKAVDVFIDSMIAASRHPA